MSSCATSLELRSASSDGLAEPRWERLAQPPTRPLC